MKVDLAPYTKIKSKWIKHLRINPETLKLLEVISLTLVLAIFFFNLTAKAKATKAKLKK